MQTDQPQSINLIREGNVVIGESHPDPFVNATWCLIYSMIERGIKGDEPWWGQDFLEVCSKKEV